VYKTELDPKAQTGERPVLTSSSEYIQKLRDSLKANTRLSAPFIAQRVAAPRTQMSQIMTHYETLEAEMDKVITASADARYKAEFSGASRAYRTRSTENATRERKEPEKTAEKDAKAAETMQKAKPTAVEPQAAR